jgi:hypothetical protein
MKFKKNILGLAIVTSIAGFSLPALAAQLDAPLILDAVEATAPDITGLTFLDNDTIDAMNEAVAEVASDQAALEEATGNLSSNEAAILEAQSAIAAANALADGELIGGLTAEEIIGDETSGQTLALTNAQALTAGYEAAVTDAQTALDGTQAVVTTLASGPISADAQTGFEQEDLADAQSVLNGTVGVASDTTLAGAVVAAEDALGDDTAGAETGLYLTLADALGAVDSAQEAVDNDANEGETVVNGAQGESGTVTFTLTNEDEIDLRDDDSQITYIVDGDITEAGDALVELINANDDFSFTAENDAGTITITYDEANDAIATGDDAFDDTRLVNLDNSEIAGNVTVDEGTTHVEDSTLSLVLADAQLAATIAQQNVDIAEADLEAAQTAYEDGVAELATLNSASDAGLEAAATHLTELDAVLLEQLSVAQADQAEAEATAAAAKVIADADLLEVTSTADALADASAETEAAQAAYDDAVAAYIADPTTETAAAMNDARDELNAATTAETLAQTAADNATDEYYGVDNDSSTPIADQDGSLAEATTSAGRVADYEEAVADVIANQTLQNEISAEGNPAAALQASLVEGVDTGAGVVSAINSTFALTADNADDIEANTADIATNVANIATNTAGIATNVANIATNTAGIATNVANIATNTAGIATNVTNIATNTAGIATNVTNIATNTGNIATNTGNIATNTGNIATNTSNIASNTSSIADLSSSLDDGIASLQRVEMQLNNDVDMLKSGIASALAIAGMPTAPGEGMGFSIGTGYYDGESAIAMGLTYVEGNRSYKFSLGNSGGETSASAGAAFKF